MHLEMKMRCVESVSVPHGADLLSPGHLLTFPHENSVNVSV